MAITRTWRIWGADGRPQAWSFQPSSTYDWSEGPWSDGSGVRIVEIVNADKTGTHEYSELRITRPTAELCVKELYGQLSDGFWENCRYGKVEEI